MKQIDFANNTTLFLAEDKNVIGLAVGSSISKASNSIT